MWFRRILVEHYSFYNDHFCPFMFTWIIQFAQLIPVHFRIDRCAVLYCVFIRLNWPSRTLWVVNINLAESKFCKLASALAFCQYIFCIDIGYFFFFLEHHLYRLVSKKNKICRKRCFSLSILEGEQTKKYCLESIEFFTSSQWYIRCHWNIME